MNIPHESGVFLELSFLSHGLDTRLGCRISRISSLAVLWVMPFLLVPFLFLRGAAHLPFSWFYEVLSSLA